MSKRGKYAAIGYVVSKFVVPMVKRQVKRSAKKKAKGAVTGTTGAMKLHPAKTSVAVGTALGAAGWLVSRGKDKSGSRPRSTDE